MADNSSLTFLQFFLPVFFFLSPSHLLSLLLPAPCDPRDGLGNLFSKTQHEMKNPEASKLNKRCKAENELCDIITQNCCGGMCFLICIEIPE
uniref:Conotoxin Superfamily SF1 n=1 Tax=Conus episcopatus TaxID=88764 RepID=A0A0K2S797_CONEP|nr:Conotoxin Superfamily SF1 [Conus episcopatus]